MTHFVTSFVPQSLGNKLSFQFVYNDFDNYGSLVSICVIDVGFII